MAFSGGETPVPLGVARTIAARYAAVPEIEAVALGGSLGDERHDTLSDIDLYVYSATAVPSESRAAVARMGGTRIELDNRVWEAGDEWIDAASGIAVDVTFRSMAWIEEQLDRVLLRHEASTGYSTGIWHNLRTARVLFDRRGRLRALIERAAQPYPDPLRDAIVAKNWPILRQAQSSYRRQIEKAVVREDWVSVNHRVAALLASYFDILFAVNRTTHPGEKRLIAIAFERCARRPAAMRDHVDALLRAAPTRAVLARADTLIDGLDELLAATGLIDDPEAGG